MKSAFTAIELVISISILGIFLLISYPKIHIEKYMIQSEIKMFESIVRENQIISQNMGGTRYVRIYSNSYKIVESGIVIKRYELRQGLKFASIKNNIDFRDYNRKGTPKNGQSIYIYDEKNKLASKITIMLGSGRVRSYDVDYKKNKNEILYLNSCLKIN